VGYSAFTLNGSDTSVKEAFDLPPWCESDGKPAFDQASYDEQATSVGLQLGDGDLQGQATAAATVSASSGDRETVTLDREARIPGLFSKQLPLARTAASLENGTIEASLGDTLTITYNDASAGGSAVSATARVVRNVTLFEDSLEAGSTNFKTSTFSLTTEAAASPTHSWTDSPGRNHADNSTYRLQLKTKFDLSSSFGSRLVFNHQYATEPGYDLCIVEARATGVKWRTIAVFSGVQRPFHEVSLDLSEFDGRQNVKVRFSLVSDPAVNDDGWHIDDIRVVTGRTQ
jgi:hypothetical protein